MELTMIKFNVYDLQIIKDANIPPTTLRRQISNMLESSEACNANVLRIDSKTGEYQIVLEGKLATEDKGHHFL